MGERAGMLNVTKRVERPECRTGLTLTITLTLLILTLNLTPNSLSLTLIMFSISGVRHVRHYGVGHCGPSPILELEPPLFLLEYQPVISCCCLLLHLTLKLLIFPMSTIR